MLRLSKKGQSVIEYATLLIIVMAVFLTASNYFKRGVQGRWKQAVDEMGDQYDPRVADTNILHTINSSTATYIYTPDDEGADGQWTNRVDYIDTTETKKGNMTIGAY